MEAKEVLDELKTVLVSRLKFDPRRAAASVDAGHLPAHGGDTTYLCAVDGDRNAVSLIQSTYEHFGSGVLAGGTGVVLQNRGACFTDEKGHPNALAPAKRPYHTIIPGLLLRDGRLFIDQSEDNGPS